MDEITSLTNHFLIAMPSLSDPNFAQTVTYICEHNDQGAMGIVINRQLEITLGDVLEQLDIEPNSAADTETRIYEGGPVQREHGFVIHSPHGSWESTLSVTESIAVSTSRDVLSAIANKKGPQNYLIALGYAGWEAGQLESELANNAWLNGPADSDVMFNVPTKKRWSEAASLLGVDVNLISSEVGHA